ncbi:MULTISPECIES: hypothetical protein [Streptomyces]|uniref:hypothetical protein n=1 Tax=Streptomyces TaxID=1883 RepID=UPI00287F63CC|nr:hypothetical protein [Streptomyces sp. CGMCC 4.1456]WNF63052.1 hypothetical protein RJD14_10840 [Streptomyces sp. CGMCC 4.1456]
MHTSLTGPPPTSAATGPARATAEELEHQKAAITRLGHELRALVEATVRTAASPDTLHRVADGVRHVTGQLTGKIFVSGSITTRTDRDANLVTADGVFIAPDPQLARNLFPGLRAEP